MTQNQKLREACNYIDALGGDSKKYRQVLALPTAEQVDDINVAESFTSVTKTAQEVGMTDEQKTWAVNQLMGQAQVFASVWSLVGGRFDFGNAREEAEKAKTELRSMVVDALRAKGGK